MKKEDKRIKWLENHVDEAVKGINQAVQDLVEELAAAGLTIVSGFMYGGDAMAHQAALKGGGQTIAVMPCGIERIHPAYQKKLYQEILEDLEDLRLLAERKDEATSSLQEVEGRLKASGLL